MKVCVIDTETTGLDPKVHSVIDFAAVLIDTESNEGPAVFHRWIAPENMVWSSFCLSLHANWLSRVLARMRDDEPPLKDEPLIEPTLEAVNIAFKQWLEDHHDDVKVTPAGKNVGSFDLQFLRGFPFRHRSFDWVNWFHEKGDKFPPDLKTCKSRALAAGCKLISKEVAHTALDDAMDVACLIQWKLGNWE